MSFVCAIPFIAGFFNACAPAAPLAVGYVEGDYVLLAPTEVGQLAAVAVSRGARVEAGETVALMDPTGAEIAVTQAEAALAEAEAQLADLKESKRPEEIAVLEATLVSADAEKVEAGRVLARTQDLFKRGIATQAELDKAQTSKDLADARVGQAKANLAVARLPARAEAINAAAKRRDQMQAALEQARWRLSERTIKAPAAGRIDDIIRNGGDIAGPSAPVVSLLPDGAVKLKVYVPEEQFSSVETGMRLSVNCDGCREGLTARISYVSPDPEFTPPVIYSLETRQKLVYLVEARPEDMNSGLQPGQIVDVHIDREGADNGS
ncbi:secretion protein HlyD family protein [Nitratireductor indicus C115]|uniref:Secretion protein HlyD family protein n=1 Tax=Nitratireductor indicus C115 TaxID=1231190 RepID=K2P1Z7_9HYPH|nr:HlyD family efflux transporter periplasmic adaptor subunit [Nitratireductor indicus]EKF44109.1 secretion protein HlyD family protein [Nitratireductor indicus C115]SFQ23477.1 HlyD family secretion protein [Nitratireductor indicus]